MAEASLWWSTSGKLAIMTLQTLGYKATVNSKVISVWIDLTSPSSITVDRLVLKIGRKEGIPSFEWKPHEVTVHEHKFLDFKRPDWLTIGKHEARLIAYTPEGYSKSKEFILEVTV